MEMRLIGIKVLLIFLVGMASCAGAPQPVPPILDFEMQNFAGKWYEIARLDHAFQRALSNDTLEYKPQGSGKIQVQSRGFNRQTGEWEVAEGEVALQQSKQAIQLKGSFFAAALRRQQILALDTDQYRYALVAGEYRQHLWVLSRSPFLEPSITRQLLRQAQQLGFPTDQMIFIDHDRPDH